MARVEITFGAAGNRSAEGASLPVYLLPSLVTEVMESGPTSVATSLSSSEAEGEGLVRILAEAEIWVVTGKTPVALPSTAGNPRPGMRVQPNVVADLAINHGDKIAIINT